MKKASEDTANSEKKLMQKSVRNLYQGIAFISIIFTNLPHLKTTPMKMALKQKYRDNKTESQEKLYCSRFFLCLISLLLL